MNEESLNIEKIKECIYNRKINWTRHCLNRMNKRNILISDVKEAICNGNIIEYYDEDYPYPSCLILGKSKSKKIIHIVCGINDDMVYMVTVYYPDRDKWENNMKRRMKS